MDLGPRAVRRPRAQLLERLGLRRLHARGLSRLRVARGPARIEEFGPYRARRRRGLAARRAGGGADARARAAAAGGGGGQRPWARILAPRGNSFDAGKLSVCVVVDVPLSRGRVAHALPLALLLFGGRRYRAAAARAGARRARRPPAILAIDSSDRSPSGSE